MRQLTVLHLLKTSVGAAWALRQMNAGLARLAAIAEPQ